MIPASIFQSLAATLPDDALAHVAHALALSDADRVTLASVLRSECLTRSAKLAAVVAPADDFHAACVREAAAMDEPTPAKPAPRRGRVAAAKLARRPHVVAAVEVESESRVVGYRVWPLPAGVHGPANRLPVMFDVPVRNPWSSGAPLGWIRGSKKPARTAAQRESVMRGMVAYADKHGLRFGVKAS